VPDYARYALIAALFLVALAISVWVFAPAFRGPEAARREVGTHRLALGAIVSALLLNALLTLPLAEYLRDGGLNLSGFVVGAVATQLPLVLIVYARLVAPGAVSWRELGLRPMPIVRILNTGLSVGIIGLITTIVVELALSQFGLRPNQFELFDFVRDTGPVERALVVLLVAVTAPFAEELFFRGYLFGLYRTRQPLWVAYVASGLLFTAAHLRPDRMNLSQMAGLAAGIFVLSTLLAFAYQRSGSLYPSMIAHAVNNLTGLLVLWSVQS
jgi:membrane protease YdiL (CAAX protease family)